MNALKSRMTGSGFRASACSLSTTQDRKILQHRRNTVFIRARIIAADLALFIDQHELGRVLDFAEHVTYVKSGVGKQMYSFRRAGEKRPLFGRPAVVFRELVEHGRRVTLRVYGNRDDANVALALQFLRDGV